MEELRFGNYAIEDTRMALREARRYGIKSITVDREAASICHGCMAIADGL